MRKTQKFLFINVYEWKLHAFSLIYIHIRLYYYYHKSIYIYTYIVKIEEKKNTINNKCIKIIYNAHIDIIYIQNNQLVLFVFYFRNRIIMLYKKI